MEIISSQYSENSSEPSDPRIEKLILELSEVISKSEIDRDLKNKFKGIVGRWGLGGAIDSFRQFLVSMKIINEKNEEIVEKKIVGINRIRNGIVHAGEIRHPSWVSGEERIQKEKIFVLSFIIPHLTAVYLAGKFHLLEFPEVKNLLENLRSYFQEGLWNGNPITEIVKIGS